MFTIIALLSGPCRVDIHVFVFSALLISVDLASKYTRLTTYMKKGGIHCLKYNNRQ